MFNPNKISGFYELLDELGNMLTKIHVIAVILYLQLQVMFNCSGDY